MKGNDMPKVYIAGSLFKEADICQRKKEQALIEELTKNSWVIYNPITADINDKSKLPSADDIVWSDFNEIKDCNEMLCALDDNDLGQAAEVGMVFGLNFWHDELSKLIQENNVNTESIQALLDKYPKKQIFAHHSDIRISTAHLYQGNYVPYGINQFLIGAIEACGHIYPSYTLAINEMIQKYKKGE